MNKLVFCAIAGFILSGGQTAMAEIEIPSYEVIRKEGPIEVRQYAPLIQAEVAVAGERNKAINAGFRLLADYIFGNNEPKKNIAMTAPVTQQKGQKIAMTAPVTQAKEGNLWKVQFTMPSSYTLDTLPRPNNPDVQIVSRPSARVVAIRFSGFWSSGSLLKHMDRLETFIRANGLQVAPERVYAFYNPPWTLPFMRRNEILYEIKE